MYLIIFGPPGAGKGTQAFRIAAKCGLKHISTGDMLREALTRRTELGLKAEAYMKKGELVPDELVVGIMKETFSQNSGIKGFLLDGFPRTLTQAEALGRTLKSIGAKLKAVINLEVDEEVLVSRMVKRRICKFCGAVYNLNSNPPFKADTCDRCGSELYQREDDKEEAVKNRLRVYQEQTKPLIEYYRKQGLIRDVDGNGSIEDITRNIFEILEA